LQAKLAQQGKHIRVGACEGFSYDSVKLVLLANNKRCEVDSNNIFLSGKALYIRYNNIVLSQFNSNLL
jgi:hypothetical protein